MSEAELRQAMETSIVYLRFILPMIPLTVASFLHLGRFSFLTRLSLIRQAAEP